MCVFCSNLNRANLKEACSAAGCKQLVPTRVGGTRWLPHTLRALNNQWEIYPALVLHLSQVNLISPYEFILLCTGVCLA